MKVFRLYDTEQMLQMPIALQEWLPTEHWAYFVSETFVPSLTFGKTIWKLWEAYPFRC